MQGFERDASMAPESYPLCLTPTTAERKFDRWLQLNLLIILRPSLPKANRRLEALNQMELWSKV